MSDTVLCTQIHVNILLSPSTAEGEGEGGGEEGDLDDDVREQLTEGEAELRAYLLHGDSLTEETIEKHATQFWNSEPYKSVNG